MDLGWGEGDASDTAMAGESARERVGIQVPEKDLPLVVGRSKEMAIGRKDHRLDPGLGGKFETVGEFSGSSIPELDYFSCIFIPSFEIRETRKPLTIG